MADEGEERPQWFQDYLDSSERPSAPHKVAKRFGDLNQELQEVLSGMGKNEARLFLEMIRFWRDFKAVKGFLKWGLLIIISAFVAGAWLVHQAIDLLSFKGGVK